VCSVDSWGGVLEHPKDSKAWACTGALSSPFGLVGIPKPPTGGGWLCTDRIMQWRGDVPVYAWVCEVEQGHYGHAARKPTWLYYVGPPPPDLVWGPSDPPAIGSGARRGNLESLSKLKRAATPRPFADLLVSLARLSLEPTP
jgi:hypothetical protein